MKQAICPVCERSHPVSSRVTEWKCSCGTVVLIAREEEEKTNVEDVLDQRKHTHGSFEDNATMTKELYSILQAHPQWDNLHPIQQIGLFMILHKVSRAVCGDFNFTDHWVDIQGYAKLVEDYCKTKQL